MNNVLLRIIAPVGVLILLLPAAEGRSLKKDLKITLREKRVLHLSPEGLTLNFLLEVANASAEPCRLTRYDYRVMVENAEFFRLDRTLDAPVNIAPSGRTLIALPVKFTYAYIQPLVPGFTERIKIDCTLLGGLVFSEPGKRGERLSLALTGDFPVFKGIGMAALPLEIRALSVGGADLSFRAEFRSLSALNLIFDSVRYRLELGGVRVAESGAEGVRFDPQEPAVLAVPLLLEFFEMGAGLFPALSRAGADFKLSGAVRVLSAWGSHDLPFEELGRVPVRRVR